MKLFFLILQSLHNLFVKSLFSAGNLIKTKNGKLLKPETVSSIISLAEFVKVVRGYMKFNHLVKILNSLKNSKIIDTGICIVNKRTFLLKF